MTNNLNPENIDDYIYDQIYVKSKKSTYITIQKNNKFIQKYIDKTSVESSKYKTTNIYKNDLNT